MSDQQRRLGTNISVTSPPAQVSTAPVSPGGSAASTADRINSNAESALVSKSGTQIPPDILGTNYYFEMGIADYARLSPISVGKLEVKDRYYLPLPTQLVDGKSINFRDDKGVMPDLANKAQNTQAGTLASAMLGVSVNQLMVVVLDRPMFKSYELTWKFVPRNEKETIAIRNLIHKLNIYTSPGLTGRGAFFKFPKIFQMTFRESSGPPLHDMLYRFKPAVVEKMRVNFAAGGMPAFYSKSNGPESVELSLSFKELEYWIDENYADQATNPFPGNNNKTSWSELRDEAIRRGAQLIKDFSGNNATDSQRTTMDGFTPPNNNQ